MKPIETRYKGYRFRSRLEARWAVFFDAIGVRWEYEAEGFELSDGTKYLPDFKIYVKHRSYTDTHEPVYIEVKGVLSEEDDHKVAQFSKEGCPIMLLGQIPLDTDGYIKQFCDDQRFNSFCYLDGDMYCALFSDHDGEVWITGADHDAYDNGRLLDNALPKARGARFEFGENVNSKEYAEQLDEALSTRW